MINSNFIRLELDSIVIPDWYIMYPIDSFSKIKLLNSIKRFGYGYLVVRNNYELIDGRKRLELLKEIGIKVVDCLHYPKLSNIDTLVLIRNLHYDWSQIDVLSFAELLNSACPKSKIDNLANIMPEDKQKIKSIYELLDFDWGRFKQKDGFLKEI